MASEAQHKIQFALERTLETLEKEKVRPLMREAHLSCARCCENQLATKEQLEQCLQRSFQPVQQVQELISKELSQFQDRLSRCAQQCQDVVQDKVSVNVTQTEVSLLQTELDKCIVKCCDNHIELIPKMMSRINQILQQFNSKPS